MGEIPKPVLERAAKALNQSMAGDPSGWEWMTGEAGAVLEAVGHAEMVEALTEARLQIEYLHEKFAETGSGNTALAKIRSALAKATGGEG